MKNFFCLLFAMVTFFAHAMENKKEIVPKMGAFVFEVYYNPSKSSIIACAYRYGNERKLTTVIKNLLDGHFDNLFEQKYGGSIFSSKPDGFIVRLLKSKIAAFEFEQGKK